jgi:hypothetical protein
VPYEITLKGESKKHKLAVRNDTRLTARVFDGGF